MAIIDEVLQSLSSQACGLSANLREQLRAELQCRLRDDPVLAVLARECDRECREGGGDASSI